MRKAELDDQGKLNIGPVVGANPGAINVAFDSADTSGIGLNIAATPAAGSERAAVKLGDFTVCQDTANDGTKNVGIVDADGVVVFSAAAGVDRLSVAEVRVKYMDAVATSTLYHMLANVRSTNLADLTDPNETDANLWARVNLMKADMLAHFAAVGSRTADGEHLAAYAGGIATLGAVAAATNTATTCTLINAISATFDAHADSAGVHFHDDAINAAYAPTSDLLAGNATKAKAITEANNLYASMFGHFSNGAA